MKEMYESGLYAETNPTWHEEDAEWKANHIRNIVQRNDIPTDRICDVGCGAGAILVNLEKSFQEHTCPDLMCRHRL